MALKQNKLTPILLIAALAIVGFVLYQKASRPAAERAGSDLSHVPKPGVDVNAAQKSGMLGQSTSTTVLPRPADADKMEETIATVTAETRDLRKIAQEQMSRLEAQNKQLVDLKAKEEEIIGRAVQRMSEQQANVVAATPPVASIVDNGIAAAQRLATVTGAASMPEGLGFDGLPAPAMGSMAQGRSKAVSADAALTKVIAPMGYSSTVNPGGVGGTGQLVRKPLGTGDAAGARTLALASLDPAMQAATPSVPGAQPEAVPYYTLPENSTLPEATAMTTLVGRVPIDGRVQDPIQFKLIVGRNNLAASGQYLPDDIAGVIVSGIAVGDMALSCTEGLIQSLTFVFDDGTVRTVSQRSNGATNGFGAGGGGSSSGGGVGGQSLASTPKLGWISDAYGNPCLPGKFVSNAPAYLTDLVMAKGFSIAGDAVAAAETTTTNGTSALGAVSSTTVTGSKGRYVLGRTAGAGSEEVVTWLMKRLNNSFDAVVVRAGTRVAIHLDQSIAIDKEPNGRKLDYARGRSNLAQQMGEQHGID